MARQSLRFRAKKADFEIRPKICVTKRGRCLNRPTINNPGNAGTRNYGKQT